MIEADYVLDGAPPADGDSLASGTGWLLWSNFVLARAGQWPEVAHLAGFGWSDAFDDLEHDLEAVLHGCDDPDLSAVTAQVLAALRGRPEGAVAFRATAGEPGGEEETAESIFREDGGLATKKVTVHRSDGSTYQQDRQVRTDAGDKSGEHHAAELHDADKAAVAGGIDKAVAELPEKPPAGLVAKAKDLALTAAARTYMWAVKLTPAAMRVGAALAEILDVPADMKKFAYNPTAAGGQDHAGLSSNDFVKTGLASNLGVGVSGHLVATVAAQVISRAVMWAKKKLAGKTQESAGDGVSEWAEMLAQLYQHLAAGLGAEGEMPSAAAIEAGLRALLEGRV